MTEYATSPSAIAEWHAQRDRTRLWIESSLAPNLCAPPSRAPSSSSSKHSLWDGSGWEPSSDCESSTSIPPPMMLQYSDRQVIISPNVSEAGTRTGSLAKSQRVHSHAHTRSRRSRSRDGGGTERASSHHRQPTVGAPATHHTHHTRTATHQSQHTVNAVQQPATVRGSMLSRALDQNPESPVPINASHASGSARGSDEASDEQARADSDADSEVQRRRFMAPRSGAPRDSVSVERHQQNIKSIAATARAPSQATPAATPAPATEVPVTGSAGPAPALPSNRTQPSHVPSAAVSNHTITVQPSIQTALPPPVPEAAPVPALPSVPASAAAAPSHLPSHVSSQHASHPPTQPATHLPSHASTVHAPPMVASNTPSAQANFHPEIVPRPMVVPPSLSQQSSSTVSTVPEPITIHPPSSHGSRSRSRSMSGSSVGTGTGYPPPALVHPHPHGVPPSPGDRLHPHSPTHSMQQRSLFTPSHHSNTRALLPTPSGTSASLSYYSVPPAHGVPPMHVQAHPQGHPRHSINSLGAGGAPVIPPFVPPSIHSHHSGDAPVVPPFVPANIAAHPPPPSHHSNSRRSSEAPVSPASPYVPATLGHREREMAYSYSHPPEKGREMDTVIVRPGSARSLRSGATVGGDYVVVSADDVPEGYVTHDNNHGQGTGQRRRRPSLMTVFDVFGGQGGNGHARSRSMGQVIDDQMHGQPHDMVLPPTHANGSEAPLSPGWGVPPTPLSPNANPAAGPAPPRIVYAPARHDRTTRYDPPRIVYMPARHEQAGAGGPAHANPEWAEAREAELRRANTLTAPPGGGVGDRVLGREERREERRRKREDRDREKKMRDVDANGQLPTPLSPTPSASVSMTLSPVASQRSGSVSLDPSRNMAGIGTRKLFDNASTINGDVRRVRDQSHSRSRSRGPPPSVVPGAGLGDFVPKSIAAASIADVKSAHRLSAVPSAIVPPGAPSLPPTAVFMAAPVVPGPPSVAGGHPGWGATPSAVSAQLPPIAASGAPSNRNSVAPSLAVNSKKDGPVVMGAGATPYPTPPGSAISSQHTGPPNEEGVSSPVHDHMSMSAASAAPQPQPVFIAPSARPSVDTGANDHRMSQASHGSGPIRSLKDGSLSIPRGYVPEAHAHHGSRGSYSQMSHASHGRHSVDVGRGRSSRKSGEVNGSGYGHDYANTREYANGNGDQYGDSHIQRHGPGRRAHSADSQVSRSSASTYYVIPTAGQKVRIIRTDGTAVTTTTTTGVAGSVVPVDTVNHIDASGATGGNWFKKALRPRFLYGHNNAHAKVPKEKDMPDLGNSNPSRRERTHHAHDSFNEKNTREMSRAGSGGSSRSGESKKTNGTGTGSGRKLVRRGSITSSALLSRH